MLNLDVCSGCGLCEKLCPNNAISLSQDERGFYKAFKNHNCIDCGLCENNCPMMKQYEEHDYLAAFAYKGPLEEREKSTSGGAFIYLSNSVLDEGGVVFGAAYDSNMCVRHTIAISRNERDSMCKSKYVQSLTGDMIERIVFELQDHKKVLFVGTPCQVSAIKRYVSIYAKDYQHAILLVDFVCSGVTSPKMFQDYLSIIERIRRKKIVDYIARKHLKGWHREQSVICYSDKSTEYGTALSQAYQNIYGTNAADNNCCYACPFIGDRHVSDITIGDFWGCKKVAPEFYDPHGISLIIVNTPNGMNYCHYYEKYGDFYQLTSQQVKIKNHWSNYEIGEDLRSRLWSQYRYSGIDGILKVYGQMSPIGSIKQGIVKFRKGKEGKLLYSIYSIIKNQRSFK